MAKFYTCNKCPTGEAPSFRSNRELLQHRKDYHTRTCGLFYEDGTHIRIERGLDGTWLCPQCPDGKMFKGGSAKLREHWILAGHNLLTNPTHVAQHKKPKDGSDGNNNGDDDEIMFLGIRFKGDAGPELKKEEREVEQALTRTDAAENHDGQMDVDLMTGELMYPSESDAEAGEGRDGATAGSIGAPQQISVHQGQMHKTPSSSVHHVSEHARVEPSYTAASPTVIPPALRAFLGTLKLPMDHVADLYIEEGYKSEEAFDIAAGIERAHNIDFAEFKRKLIERGNWIAWYAFESGLTMRAKTKQIPIRKLDL